MGKLSVGAALVVTVGLLAPTPGPARASLPIVAAAGSTSFALGGASRVWNGSVERDVFAFAYEGSSGEIIAEITMCEEWTASCTHYGGQLQASEDGPAPSFAVVPDDGADNLRVRGLLPGLGELDLELFGLDDISPQPWKCIDAGSTSLATVSVVPTTLESRTIFGGVKGSLGPWTVFASGPCGVWASDAAFAYTGR